MRRRGPLRALLRYRMALEQMQRTRVQSASAAAESAAEQLREVESAKVEEEAHRAELLGRGVSAAELRVSASQAFEIEIRKKGEEVKVFRQKCDEEQGRYCSLRQEREVVENAVERAELEIAKEAERREQARQDDATLLRLARARSAS